MIYAVLFYLANFGANAVGLDTASLGWGTRSASWLAPFFFQPIIAFILSCLVLTALRFLFGNIYRTLFSSLLAMFFLLIATAGTALIFLLTVFAPVFARTLDGYDVIVTTVASAIFTWPAQRLLRSLDPQGADRAVSLQRQSSPASKLESSQPRLTSLGGEDLYKNLLSRVGGAKEAAERLIEYERWSAPPHASRDELIRRAIVRFERDSR